MFAPDSYIDTMNGMLLGTLRYGALLVAIATPFVASAYTVIPQSAESVVVPESATPAGQSTECQDVGIAGGRQAGTPSLDCSASKANAQAISFGGLGATGIENPVAGGAKEIGSLEVPHDGPEALGASAGVAPRLGDENLRTKIKSASFADALKAEYLSGLDKESDLHSKLKDVYQSVREFDASLSGGSQDRDPRTFQERPVEIDRLSHKIEDADRKVVVDLRERVLEFVKANPFASAFVALLGLVGFGLALRS